MDSLYQSTTEIEPAIRNRLLRATGMEERYAMWLEIDRRFDWKYWKDHLPSQVDGQKDQFTGPTVTQIRGKEFRVMGVLHDTPYYALPRALLDYENEKVTREREKCMGTFYEHAFDEVFDVKDGYSLADYDAYLHIAGLWPSLYEEPLPQYAHDEKKQNREIWNARKKVKQLEEIESRRWIERYVQDGMVEADSKRKILNLRKQYFLDTTENPKALESYRAYLAILGHTWPMFFPYTPNERATALRSYLQARRSLQMGLKTENQGPFLVIVGASHEPDILRTFSNPEVSIDELVFRL